MSNQPEGKSSATGRKHDGKFAKGNKASPGRKQGSRNAATVLLDNMMEGEGQAVVQAVIDQAKAGDVQAARMILDRIAPPRKGARIQIDLPAMQTSHDVSKASAALLEAVANGDISPDEGQAVVSIVEARRRALETSELEERVSKIEAKGR